MTQPPVDPEPPIAWRGVTQDTPVDTSDGERVGVVSDLLGSDDEDIFHGIIVHLGRLGHHVLVTADHVTLMTAGHVVVDLTSDAIHELSLLSGRSDAFNWLTYWAFRSSRLAHILYPILRFLHDLLLKIQRKTKINNLGLPGNEHY